MPSVSNMSDAEIRQHLKFTSRWYALGIIDDATLDLTIRNFRTSDDDGDEHWRYGAFTYFLSQHPTLTPQQCRDLFELGAEDPDRCMGTSIMLDVLRRIECPDELYDLAASHPLTRKYAEEMRRWREVQREAAQHRKEVQVRGPENYYANTASGRVAKLARTKWSSRRCRTCSASTGNRFTESRMRQLGRKDNPPLYWTAAAHRLL